MKPETLEWIEKAEEDWLMAQRGYRARKQPSYNAACFHAQQCAEKYLKARLFEAGVGFAKTHNLIALLQLVLPLEPGWASWQAPARTLGVYAVDYRYPGNTATKANARDAMRQCRALRRLARLSFGLPM
jgi:HEPN domain-containing protein